MANTSGPAGNFAWSTRAALCPTIAELIPTEIYNQAKVALKDADALVLVVDARTELASPDYDLVKLLIRGGKPVFLAVNKVEGEAMEMAAENFRQLGLRNVYPISAEHALGIGDLLDAISEAIPVTPRRRRSEAERRRADAGEAETKRRKTAREALQSDPRRV